MASSGGAGQGQKISTAQRRAYSRDVEKALRSLAKGAGWKAVRGLLFRETDQWFVTCRLETSLLSAETQLVLATKPMAIDPIFWDICGLAEKNDQPLSFRALGAWTCPEVETASIDMAETPEVDGMAAAALGVAAERMETDASPSLPWFEAECRKALEHQPAMLASLVATLIVSDRPAQALELCLEAEAQGETGGFVGPDGSFVQSAIRWLRRSHPG